MGERTKIMPNDIIRHIPSGETLVVAGVNHVTKEICPKGYPFPSVVKMEDCELVERRYEFECQSENVIRAFMKHGMQNFIDVRSAMFHGII